MNNQLRTFFRPTVVDNLGVRQDLDAMLPGMFLEQFSSTLLDNINIVVTGFIGTAAIAGVGQISTINNTLMIVFQSFAVGGTALVAQAAGAGRRAEGHKTAGAALLSGGLLGVLLAAALFFFRVPLIVLLFGEAGAEVVENSIIYYTYTALAPPMWFIYFQCCGFMRSCGDTRRPMVVSVFSNILGIVCNLLFTFLLHMGVAGAGLSYILSVSGGAVVALAMVMRPDFHARPYLRIDPEAVRQARQVCRIGVPSSLENLMFNGTRLVIQIFLASMGAVVISANQVYNSATNVLLIPFMSINFLTASVTGRCAGRGGVQAVRPCVEYLSRKGRAYAVLTGAATILFALPLAGIFCRDRLVLPSAVGMLVLYALFMPFLSGCFILPNAFKAVGDAKFSMYVSSLSAWTFRVMGMWLLGVVLGWGAIAIVLTQGMDHIARCLIYKKRFAGQCWLNNCRPSGQERTAYERDL